MAATHVIESRPSESGGKPDSLTDGYWPHDNRFMTDQDDTARSPLFLERLVQWHFGCPTFRRNQFDPGLFTVPTDGGIVASL